MFKYPSIFVVPLLVAVSLGDGNYPSDVNDGKENENFCLLKYETGPCKAAMPRWAFNATEGKCKQFTYGGCQGNENNFLSEVECLNNCSTSICSLKPETGPCAAAIPRWAYNLAEGKCEEFSYGGCGGNTNNFETQEKCLNTCGRSVCSLNPEIGPCDAAIPRWAYNLAEGKCEPFSYGGCGGNGNNFKTQEQCLNTCGTSICSLHPETGPCEALIPRWAYNIENGKCEQFTYGGCQGNKNNFETQEQCLDTCGRRVCLLQPETGPCRAAFERWAYNAEKGRCEIFTYGGCQGNENNFKSEKECMNACGTRICLLEPEAGPCFGAIERWAFNAETGMCEQFIYGGCKGNENNFESEEQCLDTCRPSCCCCNCSSENK